ncbi:MAG: YceI family protein [Amphiplicatus sp.]
MPRLIVLFVFLLAAAACGEEVSKAAETSAAAPAPAAWTVDKEESRLGFSGVQTGKPFEGAFERWSAAIAFDPDALSSTSIEVTVDMASAKTGDRQRDLALRDADWFKVKAFPTARFVSTDVEKTGEGRYVAHGALTIRDATRPLDLPFSLAIEGGEAKATGDAKLLRTDFGVGQGEFATGQWIALEAGVSFTIVARR